VNSVRIGIVGFDHPHVLRFAPMLAAHRHATLAWIAEDGVNAGVARAMADRLGVPHVGTPLTDVDAAYIATRPGVHRPVVEELAPHGIHLLCDKPIALTAEDGRAVVDAARGAGVRLMIPFNPRGQDGPRAIKERIDRGDLGEIRLVHVVKGRFGGFGDIGLHAVDALRWLIGRDPLRVYARIHRGVRPDLAVDSIGTATIEWDGGAISTLTAGWANPDGYPTFLDARFEVVGSLAAARVDHPYQDLRVADGTRSERIAAARTDAAWNLDAFIDAVRLDAEPPITGEDGLAALQLLLACYRSSELGEEVAV